MRGACGKARAWGRGEVSVGAAAAAGRQVAGPGAQCMAGAETSIRPALYQSLYACVSAWLILRSTVCQKQLEECRMRSSSLPLELTPDEN